MEQFAVLRLGVIERNIDYQEFGASIQELQSTIYNIRAEQSEAPKITHCISAVRYIISKSTGIILPKLYIGDFCHEICSSHTYLDPQIKPLSEQEKGDLVFFVSKSVAHKAYMISHIGIFIDDEGNFFHSNWSTGGVIENIDSLMKSGRIATCRILSNKTDPRGIR